jgi:hypothetical protein
VKSRGLTGRAIGLNCKAADVVEPAHRALFDQEFTQTRPSRGHTRPGFGVEFRWRRDMAIRLDSQAQFVTATQERMNQMLIALNEPIVPAKLT